MAESESRITAEMLSALVDGELGADERATVEAALSDGTTLRAEYEALRATRAVVQRASLAMPLPEGLTARIDSALAAVDAEEPTVASEPADWQPTAQPFRRTPRLQRLRPVLAFAAAAVLVVALLPILRGRANEHRDGPTEVADAAAAWDFTPGNLASMHKYWHARAREGSLHRPMTVDEMAAELTTKVGYAVRPPDMAALEAKIVGCTSCNHAFPSGQPAAVFLMERDPNGAMTLFEVTAPADQVINHGFQPLPASPVSVAEEDGIKLAFYSVDDLHLCLTAADATLDELATLATRAVQIAMAPSPGRLQLVLAPY